MSHEAQRKFCQQVKSMYPDYFKGKAVLDVGSLDINGNNKVLFDDCDYTGIDLSPGPNVDAVCHLMNYEAKRLFDVIISTEALEHDRWWTASLWRMVTLLRPTGLLVITCASNNRPRHGVPECDPESSPATNDHYRNLSSDEVCHALDAGNNFSTYGIKTTDVDLYFWGIKK